MVHISAKFCSQYDLYRNNRVFRNFTSNGCEQLFAV